MNIEDKIKQYFQGHWPGTETPEQCNTSMSFTPTAIVRMVTHFYECGKKDMKEELMQDAIGCKVFWYDGPLLNYTQEQQDDVLEKIGAEVGDKVKLIILKDE